MIFSSVFNKFRLYFSPHVIYFNYYSNVRICFRVYIFSFSNPYYALRPKPRAIERSC